MRAFGVPSGAERCGAVVDVTWVVGVDLSSWQRSLLRLGAFTQVAGVSITQLEAHWHAGLLFRGHLSELGSQQSTQVHNPVARDSCRENPVPKWTADCRRLELEVSWPMPSNSTVWLRIALSEPCPECFSHRNSPQHPGTLN